VASSATLLFALEPFVGKVLLPRLGGAPAVWNTCVMVFQGLLLAGYWYSVVLSRVTSVRMAMLWHAGAVAVSIVAWPLSVRALWAEPGPGWPPVAWIAVVTCLAIGLPFIILSSTSPLLQVWLARASDRPLKVHRLYATANVASVGGLLVYLAVLEPFVGLAQQAILLLVAYAVAMAITLTFMWNQREAAASAVAAEQDGTTTVARGSWLRWLIVSFGASLGLYAVNTYITTDIASFPLLWCIPLTIFLLAFAFGFSRVAEARPRLVRMLSAGLVAGALASAVWFAEETATWIDLVIALAGLAGLVVCLSAELARLRPAYSVLPSYYSVIGLGGVFAGLTSVLLLPWVWSAVPVNVMPMTGPVPEYPAALALGLALIAGLSATRTGLLLAATVAGVVGLGAFRAPTAAQEDHVFEARNFFGTIRVQYDAALSAFRLWHGTTIHGMQPLERGADAGASYYGPASPIGRVLERLAPRRVLVIGLGIGTLAAYAKSGDHYTFVEIDPLVVRIADDQRWFSYLSAARARGATLEIQVGDGRLLAARLPDRHFNVIVLDAFASDSVPVHLMTAEALDLFRRKLDDGGLLALHITNRYFDFAPVLVGAAKALGVEWAVADHEVTDPYEFASSWFVISPLRSAAFRAGLSDGTWQREGVEAASPWTDNHANVFAALTLWHEVP
jgi:SAM-dependent methyltransferase